MKKIVYMFFVLATLIYGVHCVGAERYTKEAFKAKIKAEYQTIFNQISEEKKTEFFEEENRQNNFDDFVEVVSSYFVDNLDNNSEFLKKNRIGEIERTGILKFFWPTELTADVGLNTYLLELLKNAFNNFAYSDLFYTNPQGTLTENLSQYYKTNGCDELKVYSQLINPNAFNAIDNEHAKNVIQYVLENILAIIPRNCRLLFDKQFDQKSGKYFLGTLFKLRMEGTLRKYLYFYQKLSVIENIQFRLIRHGILMQAMVDFVEAASIAKKSVAALKKVFDDTKFLKEKIVTYLGDETSEDDAEGLASYLIGQINNPIRRFWHQRRYTTFLLSGLGVGGSLYLLHKYQHKFPGFSKPSPKIEIPEKIITLPEVPPVPVTAKSWGELIKGYLPKPWKSTVEPVPEPKIYPHE